MKSPSEYRWGLLYAYGIFALYFGIHTYANGQLVKTYAKGFEQNPLGDYAKNESDMVLTVYKAPLFQTYTNLSVLARGSDH
ncbi:hypothetical protein A3Q35_18665 [Aeribacillus pallidus]|uniref:hypothetical protein n=1 Tax=Aeribacillus pallidus TaxID=33936 RepID=UPI0007B4A9CD|nr:hypothetical protein [Aeribacillus pallidus]KZM57703.1 hypothetical protein A3Q35_18665 [Aeribacillus pallidus]